MHRSIHLRRTSKVRRAFGNSDTLFTVMTRFNVKWDLPHRSEEDFDRWLDGRIEAFRRYCLPAMTQQTVVPHAWFILFDDCITPSISTLLDEVVEYDWLVPLILGDDWIDTMGVQMREVGERRFGKKGFRYSCTVRLDSDDSLNSRFIEFTDHAISTLRPNWTDGQSRTVNFPYGALHLGDSYFVNHEERQFFAIFEPIDAMDTPYRTGHRRIGQVTDVYDVFTTQPMFIYHAHDANISEIGKLDTSAYQPFGDIPGLLRQFGLEHLALGSQP